MKIAVASMGNPRAVSTWSGIPAHIILALEQKGHEIIPIGLNRPQEPWHYDWLRRFYLHTQRRWFLGAVEETWLRKISKQLDEEVARLQPEVVLVIHGDWLAYSTFQQPACIIHDTTFASILNYYSSFTNLSTRSIRQGNLMYQKALQRAKAAVFSASWASQSAILDYNTPDAKVVTIPFGANITQAPGADEVKEWIQERTKTAICNLLFMGTDWMRKGGPDALQFVLELNRQGIKSKLTIVGCSPKIPASLAGFVHQVGYLKKDVEADNTRLTRILKESHALILPSLAECYGCVYCEANAYGLPALGRVTGGVSEIIKEGVNGMLLRAGESPESLAERWAAVWQEPGAYKVLAQSSYREYRERLNYEVFATRLEGVLTSLVEEVN